MELILSIIIYAYSLETNVKNHLIDALQSTNAI